MSSISFEGEKAFWENNAILLIFTTKYLPDYIYIDQFCTKVKKFIQRPTQCYKCFEYGHVVHKCSNNRRCRNCSLEHRDDDECLARPFCFNCEGDHPPSSRTCPRYKLEQEILEVANNNFISIGSAKRQVLSANKDVNSTYASAIKSFKYPRHNSDHKETQKSPTNFSGRSPVLSEKKLVPETSKRRESIENIVFTTAEIHAEPSDKGCPSKPKDKKAKPSEGAISKKLNKTNKENLNQKNKMPIGESNEILENVKENSIQEMDTQSKKPVRRDSGDSEDIEAPHKKKKESYSLEKISVVDTAVDIPLTNSFSVLDTSDDIPDLSDKAEQKLRGAVNSLDKLKDVPSSKLSKINKGQYSNQASRENDRLSVNSQSCNQPKTTRVAKLTSNFNKPSTGNNNRPLKAKAERGTK